MASVRFTQLVSAAGRPELVTLWTKPEEDRDFMKAAAENRVVTLVQKNVGSKADYGLAGFVKAAHASYLVFPRPLKVPGETRVIGIKYDQIGESSPKGGIYKAPPPRRLGIPMREKPSRAGAKVKPAKMAAAGPKLHRYRAELKIDMQQTVSLEVEALSVREAAKLLEAKAQGVQPRADDAKVTRRLGRARKIE